MTEYLDSTPDSPLIERINVRLYLNDINHYILHDAGEIMESPGKLSLVWTDSLWNIRRYLSVKLSGDNHILINGKRYPATEEALKQGLITCLKELR